jgi:hypothetical protein
MLFFSNSVIAIDQDERLRQLKLILDLQKQLFLACKSTPTKSTLEIEAYAVVNSVDEIQDRNEKIKVLRHANSLFKKLTKLECDTKESK